MSAEELPTNLEDALEEIKRLRQRVEELEETGAVDEEGEPKHDDKFWKNIREKCKKRNVSFIKELLQDERNKFTVHEKDDAGNTLLHVAAEEGCYEVVALCLNLEANLNAENNSWETAVDIAEDKGWFHIEQLLLFESMDAALGSEVNEYADKLNQQDGILSNLMQMLELRKNKKLVQDTIVDIVSQQIRGKQAFSDLLLNLAWRIITTKNEENPLNNSLWKAIQETVKEIIEEKKEREWFWLKNYLLPSTVWLIDLTPPDEQEEDDEEEEEEKDDEESGDDEEEKPKAPKKKKKPKKRNYLFYELLKMVEQKAEDQVNEILIPSMNKLQEESMESWQQLIEWDMETALENDCRQDMVNGGVIPEYSKEELGKRATASASFNVVRHYDYNEYLSKLVLHAHMVDDEYQKSIQQIFDINPETGMYVDPETGDTIRYLRGPVKLLERCKAKAETDYRNEAFPTSANVLDINRCSLIFNKIDPMLKALKKLDNKVRYYQSGCVIQLCRDKNGFREYVKNPSYADIKLNVLIAGSHGTNVIGELQFLLTKMMSFKNKAHGLYAITRRQELFEGMSGILPSLLDVKKKLFVAAGLGDIKTICDLMVTNGLTDKEIMEYNRLGECILTNVCVLGHLKALRKLKDMLFETSGGKQLFIDGILHRSNQGWSTVEMVTNTGQIGVLKYLCSIPEIKKGILDCDDDVYRLWLAALASDYVVNYECVIKEFEITDEQIKSKWFDYRVEYKDSDKDEEEDEEDEEDGDDEEDEKGDDDDEDEGPQPPDKHFHNPVYAIPWAECDAVGRFSHLLEVIDNDKFIEAMLEPDDGNANSLRIMIDESRVKLLEFVFTTEVLRDAIVNDKNQMYRFLGVALLDLDWPAISSTLDKIFNEILQITDEQWREYLLFEYPEELDAQFGVYGGLDNIPSKDDEDYDEEKIREHDGGQMYEDDVITYFDKSLLYRVFESGDMDLTAKFVDILVKEDKLGEFCLAKDVDGVSAFAHAMDEDNFECAHLALTKVAKKERAQLLDSCKDLEDDEIQEKIKEWQDLL